MWRKTHFDILNRLGVNHECDGRTDGQDAFSNSAILKTDETDRDEYYYLH